MNVCQEKWLHCWIGTVAAGAKTKINISIQLNIGRQARQSFGGKEVTMINVEGADQQTTVSE